MNTQRLVVLGLALVAAVGAAFVVRGLMGGGTPAVVASIAPPTVKMSEVLVAAEPMQPGHALEAAKLRWEKWPTKAVDASFITHDAVASIEDATKDAVVRTPLLANQPVTISSIVHAKTAGFVAATLTPGMRAISITVNTDSGAGGFILPNDRVDLLLTQKSNENPPRVRTLTILSAVRVLALNEILKADKDQKNVPAKSATLELTPEQAELVTKAAAIGQIALALRPLDSADADAKADGAGRTTSASRQAGLTALADSFGGEKPSGPVIIRYGVAARVAAEGNASETQQNIRKWAQ